MRKTNNIISFFILQLIVINLLSAQVISPFNKLEIKDTSANYSFLISGHFHGSSFNNSTFPAATLLANIDTINSLNSLFLVSLGDMFIDVNESIITHYQKSLFEKLKMPMFNSVGNHDLSNGNIYEKIYGKTFFSFAHNTELFIVLNSEIDDGSILNEQLDFFKKAMNNAFLDNIKNIFVFSHRPVWAESIEKYNNLFRENTRSALGKNNFPNDILPLLKNVSSAKHIVWVSGSMGGWAPASFFYDKNEEYKITFIQTAIRDLPRDAILQVNVNENKISFKGISLTGQELNSIENYNIDFWKKTTPQEEKFNFRMLPFIIKQSFFHSFFWIGFATATIILLLFYFIIKRWKKRK